MRRLQNKIAEHSMTLPVAAITALALQLLSRFPASVGEWVALLCFTLSAYLMVELSNSNALLRVRSRMVTSTFIVLSCAGGLLAGPMPPMLTQLSFIAALLILFMTYQNKQAVGKVFYAFTFISVASMTFVQTFMLVPIVWLLMATQLQSLSWRTWMASVLGLLTPYWLMLPWLIFERDFTIWTDHIDRLCTFGPMASLGSFSLSQTALLVFTVLLCLMGTIHFWNRSFEDRIRIRLLYGLLTVMSLVCTVFLVLQPQHYATLMRLVIVFSAAPIAHFFTFTSSRLTNVIFIGSIIVAVAIFVVGLLGL